MSLNQLAKECYQNALDKGFYEHEPSVAERIALMHSELSEKLEAGRHGKWGMTDESYRIFIVNRIGNDESFKEYYTKLIKGTGEEEVADLLIRAFDFAGSRGIDLDAHVKAKMRFNSLREFKHGKKY